MSSTNTALLVLLSAALHAAWNFVLDKQNDKRLSAVLILAVGAMGASAVAVCLPGRAFPTGAALGWALASGVGEALYFVTLARALAHSSLGLAYTVTRGGSILLVWPISVLWLGEATGLVPCAAAALVFVGLALTGLERTPGRSSRGLLWALSCAVFLASVYLGYKRALAAGAAPAALFAVSLAVALPLNVIALGPRALPRLAAAFRARPRAIVGAGVVLTASFLLFLGALHHGGAGRVLTLRNTSVVFAQAFAWLGGARPSRQERVGGALVVVGALLLGAA